MTSWLILANILAFFVFIALSVFFPASASGESLLVDYSALNSVNIFEKGYFWTLLTSMFLHIAPFHLFVNMFSLFFLGKFLEMLIGRKRFFWLYILSGLFAGLFFAALAYFFGGTSAIAGRIFGNPDTFALGASGAIFAIAGVLALLTPRNRVYLIAGPLIAIILQSIISLFVESEAILSFLNVIITIYIFFSIFAIMSFSKKLRAIAIPLEMPFWLLPIVAIVPLVIIGLFVELPIGNMAHLGGFIAGALYGIYLRLKYKRKTKIIEEYFSK